MLKVWRHCWPLVVAIILAETQIANAFDDSDCERMTDVHLPSITEPLKESTEYPTARARAISRASQEAIAQIIGLSVETSRQSNTELNDDNIKQRFNEIDKSDLSGLVKPKVVDEKLTTLGKIEAVALTVDVTVCVPKASYLERVKRAREAANRKPPEKADPKTAPWFNPSTGEPALWYWRANDGHFDFFDNEGFHPRNGQKLKPVTSNVHSDWEQFEKRQAEIARQNEAKARQDAIIAAEREKIEAAQKVADEIKREEEQRKLRRAPDLCDELAANPTDLRKPQNISGVKYETLKSQASAAVLYCEEAIRRFPDELRYTYQLARAYQVVDYKKSVSLLKHLIAKKYPAAFDNYGWSLLDQRAGHPNYEGAAASFRMGVDLGDPESMDSLANLLSRGLVQPTRQTDEPNYLISMAAAKGHAGAQAKLSRMRENEAVQQQQTLQQQRDMQMFMGVVGGVLQNIPRR